MVNRSQFCDEKLGKQSKRKTTARTILLTSFLIAGSCPLTALTREVDEGLISSCTAGPKIQFAETIPIPDELSHDDTISAIHAALGARYGLSDDTYVSKEIVGDWFYESTSEEVVFAGLTVRSHYLRLAIVVDEDAVKSIVCDSKNLDQKKNSIHRKVPDWKIRLDSKIRIELGRSASEQAGKARAAEELKTELSRLADLFESELISEKEYRQLKSEVLQRHF